MIPFLKRFTDFSVPGNRYGAILLSVFLLSLAMPGFAGWWPLLFIALVPLLLLSLQATPLVCFRAGILTGFFYHLQLLYWIIIVLKQYGGVNVAVAVLALALLALYLSVYTGVFCLLISLVAGRYWQKERSLVSLLVAAPVLWTGLDWLKGWLFTGFPWMDLAYGLYLKPSLIQAADLGGHYLVTFWLVVVNALVVCMVDIYDNKVRWQRRLEKRIVSVAACFVVFFLGYSSLRYRTVCLSVRNCLDTSVTVVQGDIKQDEKWTSENKQRTVQKYLQLSSRALGHGYSELVVWPETALPFFPSTDPLFLDIQRFFQKKNAWLLTGAPYFVRHGEPGDAPAVQYFNSALLLRPDRSIAGRYDKNHLVPFGEYVPLRSFLPFLAPLVQTITDFTPGTTAHPLRLGPVKPGVLICFESIFPDLAVRQVRNGANLLVNLTNDAWYGRSSAPLQTLAMSVFRSVESRRSLVRAANTGISCFVDPAGNVLQQSKIFTDTYLTANVPLVDTMSVYVRYGHLFGSSCFLFSLLILFVRLRQ